MAKIILDCDPMRFPYSGLYYYCLNLGLHINQLLAKQNQEPMNFYVPPSQQTAFGAPGIHIVKSKWHKLPYFRAFLNDCKVWHAPFQMGRIMPAVQKNRNTKLVLTIHDLNFLHEGKPLSKQQQNLEHVQNNISKSDAIVCISEFTKQDVLNNCDVGNKLVRVIHNGVNVDNTMPLTPRAYTPRKPFLFGIGYLNSKKNYHVLLPLLKETPEYELVLAGKIDDQDYVEAMRQKAVELGISNRLHIIGTVSDEDRAWYFKNCNAFLHPSLAEGFGIPIVEAMYFGKPVFLSDRTSIPEIAGDLGFYFRSFEPEHMTLTFKNGMEKFKTSSGMSQSLQQKARSFSWEKAAREYLALYQSLC
ncbi:glycosyltransferase family 4 protein [Filimonas effusa]|uniref:Glycosyltransferase family 1 protein n=1 Tax=Filimonas effusa TaxID=2508721 RepID=A0A4Q1DBU7_9BACT|nr:glycosyltransferase family 1 protein [Filimonas effusa]RXK86265.1 glycosyltransferase family 1 protein [Filimonas effusa]